MTDSLEIWEELVPRALAGREVELLEAGCQLVLRNCACEMPVLIKRLPDSVFHVKVAHAKEFLCATRTDTAVAIAREHA